MWICTRVRTYPKIPGVYAERLIQTFSNCARQLGSMDTKLLKHSLIAVWSLIPLSNTFDTIVVGCSRNPRLSFNILWYVVLAVKLPPFRLRPTPPAWTLRSPHQITRMWRKQKRGAMDAYQVVHELAAGLEAARKTEIWLPPLLGCTKVRHQLIS